MVEEVKVTEVIETETIWSKSWIRRYSDGKQEACSLTIHQPTVQLIDAVLSVWDQTEDKHVKKPRWKTAKEIIEEELEK